MAAVRVERDEDELLPRTAVDLLGSGVVDDQLGYDSQATLKRTAALGLSDVICAKKRPPGSANPKTKHSLGMRWPVERTNSWLSNFGQLRRNTDRYNRHRLGQIALAIALILTVKIARWAKRWNS